MFEGVGPSWYLDGLPWVPEGATRISTDDIFEALQKLVDKDKKVTPALTGQREKQDRLASMESFPTAAELREGKERMACLVPQYYARMQAHRRRRDGRNRLVAHLLPPDQTSGAATSSMSGPAEAEWSQPVYPATRPSVLLPLFNRALEELAIEDQRLENERNEVVGKGKGKACANQGGYAMIKS